MREARDREVARHLPLIAITRRSRPCRLPRGALQGRRVRAARIARFEASPFGRFLGALGIPTGWLQRVTKAGILAFAWAIVPPKLKLVAGAVVAAWLLAAASVVAVAALIMAQLVG